MNLLQQFEAEQITRTLPSFSPGDTVVVNVKVKEGNRERVQAYEGVVIAKKNAGLSSETETGERASSNWIVTSARPGISSIIQRVNRS